MGGESPPFVILKVRHPAIALGIPQLIPFQDWLWWCDQGGRLWPLRRYLLQTLLPTGTWRYSSTATHQMDGTKESTGWYLLWKNWCSELTLVHRVNIYYNDLSPSFPVLHIPPPPLPHPPPNTHTCTHSGHLVLHAGRYTVLVGHPTQGWTPAPWSGSWRLGTGWRNPLMQLALMKCGPLGDYPYTTIL